VLDTFKLVSASFGQWQGVDGGDRAELIDDDNFRYLRLEFEGDVLVGATCLGWTEHVGVLRGLIQSRPRLGPWKQRLMDDPRFGDTILDFNLYFLGFKLNSLKNDGVYDRGAFDVPNAVAAAKAMLEGGDYLVLFDLEGPYFMPPLRSTPVDDPPLHAEDAGLSAAQLRLKAAGELRGALAGLVAKGTQARVRAGDVHDCEAILDVTLHADRWYERVLRAFDDWESLVLNRGGAIIQPLFVLGAATWKECYSKTGAKPDLDVLRRGVDAALARNQQLDL